jgi:hypothetical protein
MRQRFNLTNEDIMTGLMAGKRGLIMGLANDKSLAWGIAKRLHAEGAGDGGGAAADGAEADDAHGEACEFG